MDAGQRMSKSKGTGIAPLDLIGKYGAMPCACPRVAVDRRPGLPLRGGPEPGSAPRCAQLHDEALDASRFVATLAGGAEPTPPKEGLTIEDRWILSRLTGRLPRSPRRSRKLSSATRRRPVPVHVERVLRLVHRARQAARDDAAKRVLAHWWT